MITLNFSVDDQLLTRTDENTVAANSHLVHTCEFVFSSEWDGRGKVATFKKRDLMLSVILDDDACTIPPEILQSENKIDVFELSVCGANGNSTITSTVVKVPILAGTWDVMSTEISPTMFEQIMQKIEEIEEGQVDPEAIETAIEEYLRENPDAVINKSEVYNAITRSRLMNLIPKYTDYRDGLEKTDATPGVSYYVLAPGHMGTFTDNYEYGRIAITVMAPGASRTSVFYLLKRAGYLQAGKYKLTNAWQMNDPNISIIYGYIAQGAEHILAEVNTTNEIAEFEITQEIIDAGYDQILYIKLSEGAVGGELFPLLTYGDVTDFNNVPEGYVDNNEELTKATLSLKADTDDLKGRTNELEIKKFTQLDTMPEASADNYKKIIQYSGTTTSDYTNSHIYKCIKVLNGYVWRDITADPIDSWLPIMDYPTYVYNQDKFDDMLTAKTGAMLRTDKIVTNQTSFGLNAGNSQEVSAAQTFGYNCTGYREFYWNQVETTQGVYNFSAIENYLKDEYANRRRSGLRLFINTASQQQDYTYDIDGVTYHSLCPRYIVEIMHNSSKPKYYYDNRYILTDWNELAIRDAFKNLIAAFGQWCSTSSFEDDNSQTVNYKDLIAYIDMGIMGPWGEGQRYTWQYNECSVEDMTSIYQQFLTSLPDIQCNIGQCNNPYTTENQGKDCKMFTGVKELSNNAGYVGFFLDNVGSNNRIYRDDYYIDANHNTLVPYLEKYGKRGDFFTGEFAGWTEETSPHGNSGIYALKTFKLLRATHFRLANMKSQAPHVNGTSYNIPTYEKNVYLDYVRALSCVGARFVITPVKYITETRKLIFRLVNIGLSAPYFDFYTVKVRVRNLDADEYFDFEPNIDLKSITPMGEPLLYILSNGELCEVMLPAITYTNYSISLIGVDKMGFEPMYFSNYDRNTDGSYLLFTVNNTTVTSVLQDVENLTDKIFNMTNEAIQNDVGACLKTHNDIESETIAQNWTLLYTNKVYKKDTNSYEDIPGASGYARTYAMECEAFDKLEALSWNGQINASIGDSIVFFNKDDKAVGVFRFSSNDGTAQGEQIEAPLGTAKVCFTCFNAAETMAANRVKVVKAVLVPKNTVKLSDLKTVTAASSDFSDFQTRIAAL